jgi:hypothetical protein
MARNVHPLSEVTMLPILAMGVMYQFFCVLVFMCACVHACGTCDTCVRVRARVFATLLQNLQLIIAIVSARIFVLSVRPSPF